MRSEHGFCRFVFFSFFSCRPLPAYFSRLNSFLWMISRLRLKGGSSTSLPVFPAGLNRHPMPRTSIPCMNYPGSRIEGVMEDWKLRKSLELPRVVIPQAACRCSFGVGKQRIFHNFRSYATQQSGRIRSVPFPQICSLPHTCFHLLFMR